ncbi:MAG: S-layer homology domain-containing protein [Oscillospiraceae bacterium]|nr:S-layer homology domain-containing protein [Oscillospiraceae bacterium]
MKKFRTVLAAILVAAALFGLCLTAFAANTFDYDDYEPLDWYYRYIEKATDAGWMNGVGDMKFDPNGTLSRAMFVTILHRVAGTPADDGTATFSDVVAGSWYEAAVKWAAQNGIVNGYPDGRYGVNDPLTREQMAAILYRYAGAQGKDTSGRGDVSAFADANTVSDYAKDAIAWAVAQGILSGSGNKLMPKGTSTRAQAATVLVRYESAEQSAKLTRADLEQALIDTAWAYSLKDTKIQYDSQNITPELLNKYYSGSWRLTEDAAPEFGSQDTTIFSVCSDYVQKTYYNALNERFTGYSLDWVTRCLWNHSKEIYGKDVALVRYWDDKRMEKEFGNSYTTDLGKRVTAAEMREFFRNWETTMRPGDVLVPAGHAMLYIGDGRVLDCWGGKYDMATGRDSYEGRGAVSFLHDVIAAYVDGTDSIAGSSYSFPAEGDPSVAWFLVFRPLDAITVDDGDNDPGNDKVIDAVTITPSAYSRMQYPAMEIDRSVDITPFGTATAGGTLTYSVCVSNNTTVSNYLTYRRITDSAYAGEAYSAVPVTEQIPTGTELVEGSITEGGVYKDGKITWTLDIPAGGKKLLQYTVRLTAAAGETIVSGGGSVANIPSNEIQSFIGGAPFGSDVTDALTDFYHRYSEGWQQLYGFEITDDTSLIEQFYDKVLGKTLALDDLQTMFDSIYKQVHIERKGVGYMRGTTKEAWPYTLREDAYEKNPLLVRQYVGGKSTWFVSDRQRINEFSVSYMRPGDVVVSVTLDEYKDNAPRKVQSATYLFCLGNTNYALYDTATGEFTRGRGGKELWKALSYDAFFLLRPSQAGELPDSGHKVTSDKPVNPNVETTEERQKALIATAWAYYDKDHSLLQLDQCQLSEVATANGGNLRNHYFAAPETITSQKVWYGSPHGLAVSILKNTLNHEMVPTATAATYNRLSGLMEDYNTVYTWSPGSNEPLASASELFAMLQPGDLLDVIQGRIDYVYGIYMGDGMILSYSHERTWRYDLANGVEHLEPEGAAFLVPYTELVSDAYLAQATEVHIARLVDDVDHDTAVITPAAKSRMAYPRMVIDRTVDVGPFGDVQTGGKLTYTVVITNKSGEAYTALPVTEQIPAGTTLVSAEGATNEGGKLSWSLDIPAGQSKTISFTVTVTAQPGERIVCGDGFVAEIPSNIISTTVINPLLGAEATARMEKLAAMDDAALAAELKLSSKSAVDAIRGAYAYIVTGDSTKDAKKLIAPGADLQALFESSGKNILGLYTMPASYDANKALYGMLVDGYYGGQKVHCDIARDRLQELDTRHLKAGEVLTKVEKDGTTYCIYLGGGKFLSVSDAEPTVTLAGTEALEVCFKNTILFFALTRPAQVFTAAELG